MAATKSKYKTRKDAVLHEYKGQKLILADLARLTGINKETLRGRLLRGMPVEKAILNVSFRTVAKRVNKKFVKPIAQPEKKKPVVVVDDEQNEDMEIADSWTAKQLSEQEKKRRDDAYELREFNKIAGKEVWE